MAVSRSTVFADEGNVALSRLPIGGANRLVVQRAVPGPSASLVESHKDLQAFSGALMPFRTYLKPAACPRTRDGAADRSGRLVTDRCGMSPSWSCPLTDADRVN